jgi:hypothetical protein
VEEKRTDKSSKHKKHSAAARNDCLENKNAPMGAFFNIEKIFA